MHQAFAFDLWLDIVEYRDFHDFPRYLLVADPRQALWILDCPFDDRRDDYSNLYRVFGPAGPLETAREAFDQHARDGENSQMQALASIPVSCFEFDDTKRRSLRIRDPYRAGRATVQGQTTAL